MNHLFVEDPPSNQSNRFLVQLIGWSLERSIGWSVDWLTGWLMDWLFVRLIGWLTDCWTYCLHDFYHASFQALLQSTQHSKFLFPGAGGYNPHPHPSLSSSSAESVHSLRHLFSPTAHLSSSSSPQNRHHQQHNEQHPHRGDDHRSSPSPSLEPTDLSCKSSSSPRSNSSASSSRNAGVNLGNVGKRGFSDTDHENESGCGTDNEIESDGGVSSGSSSKRMKIEVTEEEEEVEVEDDHEQVMVSRSPSPCASIRSINTSSPASSGTGSASDHLSHNMNVEPMNLVHNSRNNSNNGSSNNSVSNNGVSNTNETSDNNNNETGSSVAGTVNNHTNDNGREGGGDGKKHLHKKHKPPPITGIPTSPSRITSSFASSLQTPIVTLASPFTKAAHSLPSAAAAALFAGFWQSPFGLSPRYPPSPRDHERNNNATKSDTATGLGPKDNGNNSTATNASSSNYFQFPGGHHGSLPRTPTNINLPFSLSPLMANNPYFFDPSLLMSPGSGGSSKSTIPVHQWIHSDSGSSVTSFRFRFISEFTQILSESEAMSKRRDWDEAPCHTCVTWVMEWKK